MVGGVNNKKAGS
jgi:succinyl-CoA synthetase alpha subunit